MPMRLWTILAGALCASLLLAQQSNISTSLNGRVVDENSTPLAGVDVRVAAGGIERRAFTDPAGQFQLDLPQAGTYELFASLPGYFDLQHWKESLVPGNNEVTLTLNRVRDYLESLNVSGVSPVIDMDKTVQEQQLTTRELIDVPYRNNNDLRNAMRVLPGVVQDQNGGIHVNGASEQQVLYMLDGFNISDPLTGTFQTRL
ncbi:MAG: carboxypeptidase regulatory-like domain-containing protein, partial [Acidobacteriaceae bacterium]|nr:carboxypeptidase regulatory-like domain-containing protein [Acidobacteriaceae bacterium]